MPADDVLKIPFSKRALDLALSSVALPLLAPVFLVVAILIKLSAPGPVFYKAMRAGYKGRPFGAWKFRSMHAGSDRHGAVTARNDPRVFAAGRILRAFKIDELPQLWNIVRGEMSIVGPRPEDVGIAAACYTPRQRKVLEVAPGLTGIPQVRFFPDLGAIDCEGMDPQQHYREVVLPLRLELDLEYVRRQSLWYDLYLIAATIFLILFKSWYVVLVGTRPIPVAKLKSLLSQAESGQ
jgi:lipopolysaccharide/colanic/teichoic acid biosynthesis glycosyltransferase